jgi:hypothetical protein
MHLKTFLDAASRHGIERAAATGLYEELYPTRRAGLEPGRLLSRPPAFTAQASLSRLVQVLVWVGTLLLVGAHAWWSTSGYESLGIGLVLALTLVWQCGFLGAAEWSRRRGYGTLEAGFAAVVAFYTPLTAYSVERLLGFRFAQGDFSAFYPYVSGGWVWMELASIAVAVLILKRHRRPFVVLPLTVFTGFLAMDASTRALGGWDERRAIETAVLVCGVAAIAAAVALDYRGWRRFAFWPHVGGVWLVVWSLGMFCGRHYVLALIISGLVALVLGVWLARITHLAAAGVLGWAALGTSAHGAAFPFLLMAGGLAFIAFAVWLARKDSAVRRWLAARGLPAAQRDLAY